MDYLLLILGFAILIVSGNLLVKGGVELAGHLKISKLVIGVTIVSLGTSAPELFVSVGAALKGSPDISFGNVIGSNIANIGLVLGLTALVFPVPTQRDVIIKDWPVMMFASVLLLLSVQDMQLVYWEGIIFLVILVSYIIWLIRSSRIKNSNKLNENNPVRMKIEISIGFIILAIAGLYFGSELLINSAKLIARNFGVSERIIGLTLVAFGTSVPEMVTSLIAAIKKQMDISVGNIIGSNIYNILAILGVTSLIQKIHIDYQLAHFDIYCMIAIAALLLLMLLPFRKPLVSRYEGALLLLAYASYIYFIFL